MSSNSAASNPLASLVASLPAGDGGLASLVSNLKQLLASLEPAAHNVKAEMPLSTFVELAIQEPGVPRVNDVLAAGTRKERTRVLRAFACWIRTARGPSGEEFGDAPAHHVTPFLIDRYSQHVLDRGCRPTTLVSHLRALKRAFNYGIQAKILPIGTENPVGRIRRRSLAECKESVDGKCFNPDEIAAILRACREGYVVPAVAVRHRGRTTQRYAVRLRLRPPAYLGAAVELALETGLRRGELRNLRWDAIDFQRGILRVRHDSSKSGGRLVPLTDRALEVLEGLPRRAPYVLTNCRGVQVPLERITASMRKLLRGVGVRGKSFHGLRHTFAQRAVAKQVAPNYLQAVLGHSSLEITNIYLRTGVERGAPEFRRLMQ